MTITYQMKTHVYLEMNKDNNINVVQNKLMKLIKDKEKNDENWNDFVNLHKKEFKTIK